MKKCGNCGIENSDAMRFCVECGTTLANSPAANMPRGGVPKAEEIPATVIGEMPNSGAGRQNFSPQIQQILPPKRKSKAKIFLVLGGLFILFLLFLTAGAAILFFNWQAKNNTVAVKNNPTPTRNLEKKTITPSTAVSPDVSDDSDDDEPPPKPASGASADFDKLWVDYNVTEEGQVGMRIHVKFVVHNMKNVNSAVAIYFQKEDGTKLLTNNEEYAAKDGGVAVYKALKPSFDETVYEDLPLFIPYNEFNLSRGKYVLKMDADLIDESSNLIQHLTFENFDFEKP